MDALKRAVRFQWFESLKSMGVFWIVMLLLNIASYIVNYRYGGGTIFYGIHHFAEEDYLFSIAGANVWPIFVYFIVYCYELYYESFPIAASFSITRTDFYKSVLIFDLVIAAIFALIQDILMKMDIIAVEGLGITPYTEFGLFNTREDSFLVIIFSLFAVFIFIIAIMNILAMLNYRFGWKIWIVIIAISSILLAFGVSGLSTMVERAVTVRIDFKQIIYLIIPILVSYLAGFALIRNTNIKNRIG